MPLYEKRIREPVENLLCKPARRGFVVRSEAVDDHGELVAGESADDRALGEDRRQSLCHRFKGGVPREVTECVVDLLEMIHIDIKQAQGFSGPTRAGNAALQQMLELHAVRDFCKSVDTRQVTNAFLGAPPFGDVLRGVDPIVAVIVPLYD